MSRSDSIRRYHRWLSIALSLAVIANLLVIGRGDIATWVGVATLLPFALLLCTGLYLFALPHVAKWRQGRSRTAPRHQTDA